VSIIAFVCVDFILDLIVKFLIHLDLAMIMMTIDGGNLLGFLSSYE